MLLCGLACTSRGQERVYVVDDGVKIGTDGRILGDTGWKEYPRRNPAWDGTAITLSGARRETVAFQVIVEAGAAGLKGVDVHISELRAVTGRTLGGDPFALFREWYVPVTTPSASPGGSAGPGHYPDALIPGSIPGWGLPVDVAPRATQGVWVDCAIPESAPAGAYHGALTVTAGTRVLGQFRITLTVRDFALPAETHLRWRVGYSGWEFVPQSLGIPEATPEWLDLERQLYRMTWEDHRVAPTTHYHDIRLPTRNAGRAITIDWSEFDRRFGPYLDGSAFRWRVPVAAFSLPINLHRGWPARLSPDPASVDEDALEALARLVGRHWDEKGWRIEDAFVYVADEPGPEKYESIRRACAAIRRGDARIRTSVAFYTEFGRHARRLVETFGGLVTLWDVAADQADLPALRTRRMAGDAVGIYQGGEPYIGGEALDNDGLALATWPWVAWRYDLDELFLYNMTEWDYARVERSSAPWASRKHEIWENPLNQSWVTNSQGVLIYPGPYVGLKGFVPSIRLKQMRRGMQDYEYLWLAAQRGHRSEADATCRRLVPRALYEAGPLGRIGKPGAWEHDPRAWAEARDHLARMIAK